MILVSLLRVNMLSNDNLQLQPENSGIGIRLFYLNNDFKLFNDHKSETRQLLCSLNRPISLN